jgi:hypothetical protein
VPLVPGDADFLIPLLRDPVEHVRQQAAESLTRIRFYHEQQAHWDRALEGLDASPASAAEKLLLQAKPDQPRAQRLLALQSLGDHADPPRPAAVRRVAGPELTRSSACRGR